MDVIICRKIKGINYSVKADEAVISKAEILFKALEALNADDINDGYKLEIGFSVFIMVSQPKGYSILVPDYTDSPFTSLTDDLTIGLWILSEQAELLYGFGFDEVSVRFDDEITVAENTFKSPWISMQRYPDLGKNHSGWCIEGIEKDREGKWRSTQDNNYRSVYAYELLNIRPSLIKYLILPYNYIAVFDGGDIAEILNSRDESILE